MFLEEEAPALVQALPFNDLMKKFLEWKIAVERLCSWEPIIE